MFPQNIMLHSSKVTRKTWKTGKDNNICIWGESLKWLVITVPIRRVYHSCSIYLRYRLAHESHISICGLKMPASACPRDGIFHSHYYNSKETLFVSTCNKSLFDFKGEKIQIFGKLSHHPHQIAYPQADYLAPSKILNAILLGFLFGLLITKDGS